MKLLFFFASIAIAISTSAQKLKPGFDIHEYDDLLSLAYFGKIKPDSLTDYRTDKTYHMEYRSEEVGLLNRWTLFLRNDNVGIIDVRGTVNKTTSWLANFYAGMVPATGTLQLNDTTTFAYQLAADPKANVHVGWTVSLGFLGPDIVKHLNDYYKNKQVKEYFIIGHSQGGAIGFLLRSYLEYEKKKGHIPADLVFKTYCSAAPKPGDMFYTYDYDFITRGGWGFNVVNAADWVPESPFTIQQLTDFNTPNPFLDARAMLNKQKLMIRIVGKSIYNKLERKPRKAQRKHERYLANVVYKRGIKKVLPQMKEPEYSHAANFMRAGVPIVLMPDESYWKLFPVEPDKYFRNHTYEAYHFLATKYYPLK